MVAHDLARKAGEDRRSDRPRSGVAGIDQAHVGNTGLAVVRGSACMLPVEWEDKELKHFMVDLPYHVLTSKF